MSEYEKPKIIKKKYDRNNEHNGGYLDSLQVCKVRTQMGLPCRNCCYYESSYCFKKPRKLEGNGHE